MILGVLGGVGAGKTTVTKLFLELGAEGVDADEIAHEVIQLPEMRTAIEEWLGPDVLDGHGQVQRAEVGQRVFSDPAALAHLERLLHPEIERRIERRIQQFRAAHSPQAKLLVLDISLLATSPLRRHCDANVFVDARDATRKERTRLRGWTPEEHDLRDTSQPPLEVKRRLADFVIDNSGSLEETRRQVEALYSELMGLGAGRPRQAADKPAEPKVSSTTRDREVKGGNNDVE